MMHSSSSLLPMIPVLAGKSGPPSTPTPARRYSSVRTRFISAYHSRSRAT